MVPTSSTLLLKLRENGPSREIAWGQFRQLYAPVIAAFGLRLGAAPHELDDLVQDVMLGFFAAQPRFTYDPSKGRLRSYLKACVFNRLAAHAKAGRRLRIDGRPVEEIDPADDSVEQAWVADWEREHLHRAVEQVREQMENDATFNAFHRLVVDGADVATVAAEFGISANAVYIAKSRCLTRLRVVLAQLEEAEG